MGGIVVGVGASSLALEDLDLARCVYLAGVVGLAEGGGDVY